MVWSFLVAIQVKCISVRLSTSRCGPQFSSLRSPIHISLEITYPILRGRNFSEISLENRFDELKTLRYVNVPSKMPMIRDVDNILKTSRRRNVLVSQE